MHLHLTDRLACPRCGPDFGLILLAHDVRERRVMGGDLGCSNCRQTYPVAGGFADLRPSPRRPLEGKDGGGPPAPPDSEEALRAAALLGVAEGPGTLLIKGPAARLAPQVANLVGGVEVVGLDEGLAEMEECQGVSRMVSGSRIPFFSDTFQGILLSGEVEGVDVEEAVRVLAPSGRLATLGGPSGISRKVKAMGLKVILEEKEALVALLENSGAAPLVTLRGI